MSEHTPGPWGHGFGNGVTGERASVAVYWDGKGIHKYPVTSGNEVVCWLAGYECQSLIKDARLIAAAPDLLAALESANSQMEMAGNCIENGRYDEALLHVRSMIRSRLSAIAKAKGK